VATPFIVSKDRMMQHCGMTETSHQPSTMPSGVKPLRLRPPRHRVERRAILLWTLHALIETVIFVGGLGLTYMLVKSVRPWVGPILTISAILAAVNVAVMPTWRYLVHRWEFTDQAVYSLKGWLDREWRIAPVSRIQTIDTVTGPLQQLLHLATVKVTTASREGGISITGLDAEVAAEAARRLTEITQITPGDAT
jgi:membrane protein YdbS with pleckstrin-like domain